MDEISKPQLEIILDEIDRLQYVLGRVRHDLHHLRQLASMLSKDPVKPATSIYDSSIKGKSNGSWARGKSISVADEEGAEAKGVEYMPPQYDFEKLNKLDSKGIKFTGKVKQ